MYNFQNWDCKVLKDEWKICASINRERKEWYCTELCDFELSKQRSRLTCLCFYFLAFHHLIFILILIFSWFEIDMSVQYTLIHEQRHALADDRSRRRLLSLSVWIFRKWLLSFHWQFSNQNRVWKWRNICVKGFSSHVFNHQEFQTLKWTISISHGNHDWVLLFDEICDQ